MFYRIYYQNLSYRIKNKNFVKPYHYITAVYKSGETLGVYISFKDLMFYI